MNRLVNLYQLEQAAQKAWAGMNFSERAAYRRASMEVAANMLGRGAVIYHPQMKKWSWVVVDPKNPTVHSDGLLYSQRIAANNAGRKHCKEAGIRLVTSNFMVVNGDNAEEEFTQESPTHDNWDD